jgi:hypothetical protein
MWNRAAEPSASAYPAIPADQQKRTDADETKTRRHTGNTFMDAESSRLTLAFVQSTATRLMLEPEAQAKDDAAWAVKYGLLPADRFPLLHESSTRLTELFRNDDEVFELVLQTFLDGVAQRIEHAQ